MSTHNQAQTEALIRLMLAARYADHMLSLSEGDAFEEQVSGLSWNSSTALDKFLQQATADVRKALSTEAAKQSFLEQQCALFTDTASKRAAIQNIEAVLQADGNDPKESKLLLNLRSMLKV